MSEAHCQATSLLVSGLRAKGVDADKAETAAAVLLRCDQWSKQLICISGAGKR